MLNITSIIQVDVDQFQSIEIEEFPVQIAQVALRHTDHQMNARVSEEFGQYFVRLPLAKSAHIVHGNALRLDWNAVIPAAQCSFVMGNPPFIGAKFMNEAQRADVTTIFHDTKNAGLLDYVACWYRKATDYMAQIPLDPHFSKGEVESGNLNAHTSIPPFAKGEGAQHGGISAIETASQAVLDARAQFPDSALADLYDPLAIPPELVRAHQTLDRAVDAAYSKKNFASEAERVAFLFERYQAITSLLPAVSAKRTKKPQSS